MTSCALAPPTTNHNIFNEGKRFGVMKSFAQECECFLER